MLKSPKAKGSQGEREAVKALEAIGLKARKQPLSGALQSFPYDIAVSRDPGLGPRMDNATFTCEVKRYKRESAMEKLRNGADLLMYRADRGEWCVWMPLTTLRDLL